MNRREKLLLVGLVSILVVWQGGSLVNRFVFEPADASEDAIIALQKRISSKKQQLKKSKAAEKRLEIWNQRSLPPDPLVAAPLYQNWLVELATRTKLANLSVTPNRMDLKPKGEAYFLIAANIDAQGTLSQLCDFLFELRRAGLLHRVANLAVTADKHEGDPQLKIDLTVEGLALKDSPPRNTLFAKDDLSDLPADKPAKDRAAYAALMAKNLFVRGYNGPPKPPPGKGPNSGEEDKREFVYLVGSVADNGSFDAYFYDRSSNKSTRVSPGSAFNVVGVQGKVLAIGADSMTLEIQGEPWRLELGKNLRQMEKLPQAAPSQAGNPN